MLTRETAWAVGLFEGEGSICWLTAPEGRRQASLGLATTDEDVAHRFHAAVGTGFLYGPYSNGPGRKVYWQWRCRDRLSVIRVLEMFSPMLGSRRGILAKEMLTKLKEPLPPRPEEVPASALAFLIREHEQGHGWSEIARRLNDADVPTVRDGVMWWPSTVKSIITRLQIDSTTPGERRCDGCARFRPCRPVPGKGWFCNICEAIRRSSAGKR